MTVKRFSITIAKTKNRRSRAAVQLNDRTWAGRVAARMLDDIVPVHEAVRFIARSGRRRIDAARPAILKGFIRHCLNTAQIQAPHGTITNADLRFWGRAPSVKRFAAAKNGKRF